MHLPQIILSVLLVLSLGIAMAKNGESRGTYSFFVSLFSVALEFVLLYWGGFFK
jgi:hypothetical protein